MVKLLSIISLILALVLFPPAALALISNNAVPGDATYPIKRTLEDAIFTVASIHPTSKAWFAAARSDRRFKEFTTLVAQGKKTSDTLNELVEQTQVAADQVAKVSDEVQKEKLAAQLAQSIQKYDQGLQQLSPSSPVKPTPLPQPPPHQQEITPPQTPKPSLSPPSTPTPTAQPTPTATSAPTPAPAPHPSDEEGQRKIEEARKKLEEIRRRLEEQQRQRSQDVERHETSEQERRQESKKESHDKKESKQGKKEDQQESSQEKENSKDKSKKNKD